MKAHSADKTEAKGTEGKVETGRTPINIRTAKEEGKKDTAPVQKLIRVDDSTNQDGMQPYIDDEDEPTGRSLYLTDSEPCGDMPLNECGSASDLWGWIGARAGLG
jgi:hypothetical protein